MEDILVHHGILGMKWGIRRYQNKDGTLTSAGKKRYSNNDDIKDAQQKNTEEPKKKSVKDMSDEELRREVNRMQLEQNYLKMTGQNIEKGKSAAEIALGKMKESFVSTVAQKSGQILAERLVNLMLGVKNDKENKDNSSKNNSSNKNDLKEVKDSLTKEINSLKKEIKKESKASNDISKSPTKSGENTSKSSNESYTIPWQYSKGLQRYERKRTSNPTGFIGKYGR